MYFKDLLDLTDRLISDIGFLQNPSDQIIKTFECKSVHLKKNIAEYLDFVDGKKLNLSLTVLSKRELAAIKDFFERLGTLDLDNQINELSAKRALFLQFYSVCQKRDSSFGKAYIKLGFLMGLAVGIMMI